MNVRPLLMLVRKGYDQHLILNITPPVIVTKANPLHRTVTLEEFNSHTEEYQSEFKKPKAISDFTLKSQGISPWGYCVTIEGVGPAEVTLREQRTHYERVTGLKTDDSWYLTTEYGRGSFPVLTSGSCIVRRYGKSKTSLIVKACKRKPPALTGTLSFGHLTADALVMPLTEVFDLLQSELGIVADPLAWRKTRFGHEGERHVVIKRGG